MSLQPAESRLMVPFAGTVSARGPLTWGQKALVQDQRETGWALNATGAQNLAPGVTVAEAAARLGRLVGTHPALRVRLDTDPDGTPLPAGARLLLRPRAPHRAAGPAGRRAAPPRQRDVADERPADHHPALAGRGGDRAAGHPGRHLLEDG